MAEALAIIGGLGAICNLIDAIGNVVSLVNSLISKWEDADLSLLSMASQLTALRAAITKIREWTEQGLDDAHHQLIMDLDVSIRCCQQLITKMESLFSELTVLIGKPLESRQKFKFVFGNAGLENIQKMIERQTSALTLLLTACNCNSLSEQHRHLNTTDIRKVLKRARADSVSLYVHRDAASCTSKATDNLSKMSRVFDFDRDVFSTSVYERAFRASIQQALRRRPRRLSTDLTKTREPVLYENIYLVGRSESARDSVVNAFGSIDRRDYSQYWTQYEFNMKQVFVDLMCVIAKREMPQWAIAHVSVLDKYSDVSCEVKSTFEEALEASVTLWESCVRSLLMPDPNTQDGLRETVQLRRDFDVHNAIVNLDMVFSVCITANEDVVIACINRTARLFAHHIIRAIWLRENSQQFDQPSSADICRARALIHPNRIFERRLHIGSASVCLTEASGDRGKKWPSSQQLRNALAIAYVFDLRDHSSLAKVWLYEARCWMESATIGLWAMPDRGAPRDLPLLLLLTGAKAFKEQVEKTGFLLSIEQTTNDYATAIAHIEMLFRQAANMPLRSLVLDEEGDEPSIGLVNLFQSIAVERNGVR